MGFVVGSVGPELEALVAAVDGYVGAGLPPSSERLRGELVELSRLMERIEATRVAMVRALDRTRAHVDDDHGCATSWLRARCGLGPGVARARVSVARRLEDLPVTGAAFAAGEIGFGHVRVLAVAAGDQYAGPVVRELEPQLVEVARVAGPDALRRVVDRYVYAAADDGGDGLANALHARRGLHLSPMLGGMVAVSGELDPESGETVLTAVQAMIDSDHDTPGDPRRSAAQRRADALTEICRRFLDGGVETTHAGERPHLSGVVDLDVLDPTVPTTREPGDTPRCELDHVGPVAAETMRRLFCDSIVTRIVMTGDSEVLDVGRRTRTVSPALRRALAVRDRHCTHPGCDTPAIWCDAHHVTPWARGGETNIDQLVLLCRRHHRHVHEGGSGGAHTRHTRAGPAP